MTIDIMMPFYGRFDHFRFAVESVLAQTSDDWRLTIFDDMYPDPEPGEWAKAINDPRVTYVRNETNLGVSGNFRKCVASARAEYTVIFGCDDIMMPDYVARIEQLSAKFPGAAFIQPGVEVIDDQGRTALPLADRVKSWYRPEAHLGRELSGEMLARSLLRGNWAYFPSLCWRTVRLQSFQFRMDYGVVQDLALMLEMIEAGDSMVVDDQVVFSYRRHAASVSAVTGPDGSKFIEERRLFSEAAERMARLGWKRAAAAARLHLTSRLHALSSLPAALRAGDGVGTKELLRHSFKIG